MKMMELCIVPDDNAPVSDPGCNTHKQVTILRPGMSRFIAIVILEPEATVSNWYVNASFSM